MIYSNSTISNFLGKSRDESPTFFHLVKQVKTLFVSSFYRMFKFNKNWEKTFVIKWWKVGGSGNIVIDLVDGGGFMFMGEFEHSLDNKGRLIIPSKFRDQLGEDFVITRGLDGCLFGYPLSEWKLVEEKLSQLPSNKKIIGRLFVLCLLMQPNVTLISREELSFLKSCGSTQICKKNVF